MTEGNGRHRQNGDSSRPQSTEAFLESKLPISDVAAEQGYIGSALWDPKILDEHPIRSDQFYLDAHQKIVRLMQERRNAGLAIDPLTVNSSLQKLGSDDAKLWERVLIECVERAQHPGNAGHYSRTVRERFARRSAVYEATGLIRELYEAPDVQTLLGRHLETIGRLAETSEADDATECGPGLLKLIDYWKTPEADGRPTGYRDLDEIIRGWQPQRLYLLAANTGIGKTALAINFAAHVSKFAPVLFISLEMPETEVFSRLVSSIIRKPTVEMRNTVYMDCGTEEITEKLQEVSQRKFKVDDRGGRTVASIAAQARKHHRKTGLGMLIVDYIGLIEPVDKRIARHEQIGSISRGLKLLAKDLRIPVLGLSQLSRQASGEGVRPQLHHLRESGSLEQDSDVVMFIHRDRHKDETKLIVEKNRSGKIGEVDLTWNNTIVRFDAPAQEWFDPIGQ